MSQVKLLVDGGADEAALHRLTASLFKDLRATGLVKVTKPEEDAPSGSKSGTAAQLGELVITGVFSVSTVTAVARVITAYIDRTKVRKVIWQDGDHKVELTAMSKKDQLAALERLAERKSIGADQPGE